MYDNYFTEGEIKPEFEKEFVSLWPFWLGKENLHKLDEVTEQEWSKFNFLIRLLAREYDLEIVNRKTESLSKINNIADELFSYKQAMEKESADFTRFVVPDLECVFSEEWDYTYIIWHKNNSAISALESYIDEAGLHHFNGK